MALVACPTGSIGTREKTSVRGAIDAFPEPVDENVYFCGFASPNSFGAASYLITRPNGNVLIDSPRYAKNLVGKLEAMGGVAVTWSGAVAPRHGRDFLRWLPARHWRDYGE